MKHKCCPRPACRRTSTLCLTTFRFFLKGEQYRPGDREARFGAPFLSYFTVWAVLPCMATKSRACPRTSHGNSNTEQEQYRRFNNHEHHYLRLFCIHNRACRPRAKCSSLGHPHFSDRCRRLDFVVLGSAEVDSFMGELNFCLGPSDSVLSGPSLLKDLNTATNKIVKNLLILNSPGLSARPEREVPNQEPVLDAVTLQHNARASAPCGLCSVPLFVG